MKTYSPKPADIEHRWYVVDASGQVLGRLATEVATLLRGKHKPIYAPHMDTGDHVIVINADKVELTGQKAEKKVAYRHSGYPGGIKGIRYTEFLTTRPVAAVEKAVRGMLPHNRLGRQIIKKLHVVAGPEHPHQAQKPVAIDVGQRPSWDGFPVPAPVEEPSSPKAATTTQDEAKAAGATATKSPAKKPAAGTAPKKPTAAKSPAKKTTAKKTTAKKTTAKKPATEKDEE